MSALSGFANFKKDSKDEIDLCLPGILKYRLVGEAWGYTGKQAGYYISVSFRLSVSGGCVDMAEIWQGG